MFLLTRSPSVFTWDVKGILVTVFEHAPHVCTAVLARLS